jgi:hypothetical protein
MWGGGLLPIRATFEKPERIYVSSGHNAVVDATIIGESISYNHDDAHDTFMTLSAYTSAREDEVRQLGRIYN